VDVPDYVEQLRRDGERLATVASFTDPGAPVPTCPDWSLRDLLHHVGGVHRWATGFVRGDGRQPPDGDLERFVGGWPEDAELVAWFADGHRALAEALASAPADLETWTFLEAPTPLAFWARRQAHETTIHRVDAESASGDVTGFPSGFAVDGIDELLLRFANRPGRPLPAVETMRSMVVRARDEPRSWRVTFAPSGFQIEADPIDDDAELLVTGDASELYVLLWNRRDAAGSEMDGEPDPLDLWRETAQIRGAEDRHGSRGERAKSRRVQEPNDPSPSGAQDGDRRLRRDQHRSPARGWRLALDVSRGRPPKDRRS
jgi:uncharacterized protein (TIGR03083 family)